MYRVCHLLLLIIYQHTTDASEYDRYKFAILELKAILSVLVDSFQFAERSPGLEVERRSAIVMRPYIIGEEEDGGKMPLRVSRAEEEEEE